MVLCELAITAISLLASIVFFVQSLRLPQLPADPGGPSLFPRLMCFVTGIAAIILLVQLFGNREKREEIAQAFAAFQQFGAKSEEAELSRRRLYIVILSALYPFFIVRLGFMISTIVFLFVVLKVFKVKFLPAAVYSLVLGYGVYYVFAEVLRAYIPPGMWLSGLLG